MEVILREDIEKLGNRGQVVNVAPGYARNFLLPKRLAVAATDANRKIVPRRLSGVCAPHQKRLSEAIKQARNIALIPFTTAQQ